HPVAQYFRSQFVTHARRSIQIVDVHTDRVHPVLETIFHSRHWQIALVGAQIAADYREAAGAVLQQAQVTLALVEQVLLDRSQCQIQIQASERGWIQVDLDTFVHFVDVWADRLRTHTEEYPLHFRSQFLDHISDQLQ